MKDEKDKNVTQENVTQAIPERTAEDALADMKQRLLLAHQPVRPTQGNIADNPQRYFIPPTRKPFWDA